jgi:ketosteroid isomerase-like protein
MITTEPKEERVRRAYLAFANGNWAIVDSLLADDIVWHEQGRTDVNQRMNVISYLERDLRPRTVVTELLDVSRAGDRLRSVERSKMERTPGREDEHRSVSYFRFDDEGNIAEVWHGAEQERLEV